MKYVGHHVGCQLEALFGLNLPSFAIDDSVSCTGVGWRIEIISFVNVQLSPAGGFPCPQLRGGGM